MTGVDSHNESTNLGVNEKAVVLRVEALYKQLIQITLGIDFAFVFLGLMTLFAIRLMFYMS